MKNLLLPIAALVLPTAAVNAQNSCDSLQIIGLEYAPFTDTAMQVIVLNESQELFGYPQFSLIDTNGDMLVSEALNFFGIGWNSPSVHRMDLLPGNELPESPFTGTLSLLYFTGDGTPTCTFPIDDEPLCPQGPCTPFQVFLYNDAPVIGLVTDVFIWNITNQDNEIVASGTLQIDAADQQQAMEEVCLPPGAYVLNMDQGGSEGTTFTIGVTQNGFMQNGPVLTMNADSSIAMPFVYYPVCAQIGMGLGEDIRLAPALVVNGNALNIIDRTGSALGAIRIHDIAGREIHSTTVNGPEARIDLTSEAGGVYMVRYVDAKWPVKKFMLE